MNKFQSLVQSYFDKELGGGLGQIPNAKQPLKVCKPERFPQQHISMSSLLLLFSSGIMVTEVLSASSTLVLLSSACDVCAMTQDSADCDTTAAGAGANCLPVPGVWEALLPEQSSDNV